VNGKFFSDEKINTGRQPELDILKALCIVGMVFVHVFLDLGKDVMPTVIDDYLTEFFGAATFMVCMGIGMCYMHRQSPSSYFKRGFGLLTIGQFLNILRNSIPNLIAYKIVGGNFFIANALLILQSDILSFAGLAFLLMALLKKLKLNNTAVLGVGFILNLAALVMWHQLPLPKSYLARQLLGFIVITDAEAYFPLFCYFIFAAFGYFIGGYYPRIKDKNALANRIMAICFPVSLGYYVLRFIFEWSYLPELGSDMQYNMKPTPDAVATCLFTLGILAVLVKIANLFKNGLPKIVLHVSENINSYYCIHYLFVLPMQTVLIAATGERMPGKILPILYAFGVLFACYFLVNMNIKHWHIHFASLKGRQMIIFAVAVWAATVAITAYAYPRITEFANVWNDYLLPE